MEITREHIKAMIDEANTSGFKVNKERGIDVVFQIVSQWFNGKDQSIRMERNAHASTSQRAWKLAQDLENLKHTLKGITEMKWTEGRRMKMWAQDAIAGFKDSINTTLLDQANVILSLRKALTELEILYKNQGETIARLQGQVRSLQSVNKFLEYGNWSASPLMYGKSIKDIIMGPGEIVAVPDDVTPLKKEITELKRNVDGLKSTLTASREATDYWYKWYLEIQKKYEVEANQVRVLTAEGKKLDKLNKEQGQSIENWRDAYNKKNDRLNNVRTALDA